MQQDDFISAVLDTVSSNVSMSKAARAKIDTELRLQWAGAPVYIKKREPTYRESIRAAVGTHEEIAKKHNVSVRTVFRVRKGR